MVILSLISLFYDAFRSNYYIAALLKGMTAGVGAVIISVVYDMGKNVAKSKDLSLIHIFRKILRLPVRKLLSIHPVRTWRLASWKDLRKKN